MFLYVSTSLWKYWKCSEGSLLWQQWTQLGYAVTRCLHVFWITAGMSTFQVINPKENLIFSLILLLALMVFLQQRSASAKTNGFCIMRWKGDICAQKQSHLSGFKHSCFDLLSLKFNIGGFFFFLWTFSASVLVKILHQHFRNGAAVLFWSVKCRGHELPLRNAVKQPFYSVQDWKHKEYFLNWGPYSSPQNLFCMWAWLVCIFLLDSVEKSYLCTLVRAVSLKRQWLFKLSWA